VEFGLRFETPEHDEDEDEEEPEDTTDEPAERGEAEVVSLDKWRK
jgi:hypothetical protein